MKRSDPSDIPLGAACEKCGAEIIYADVERETPAVCPSCGEPIEISVIEDSTANGFDPTAYTR